MKRVLLVFVTLAACPHVVHGAASDSTNGVTSIGFKAYLEKPPFIEDMLVKRIQMRPRGVSYYRLRWASLSQYIVQMSQTLEGALSPLSPTNRATLYGRNRGRYFFAIPIPESVNLQQWEDKGIPSEQSNIIQVAATTCLDKPLEAATMGLYLAEPGAIEFNGDDFHYEYHYAPEKVDIKGSITWERGQQRPCGVRLVIRTPSNAPGAVRLIGFEYGDQDVPNGLPTAFHVRLIPPGRGVADLESFYIYRLRLSPTPLPDELFDPKQYIWAGPEERWTVVNGKLSRWTGKAWAAISPSPYDVERRQNVLGIVYAILAAAAVLGSAALISKAVKREHMGRTNIKRKDSLS